MYDNCSYKKEWPDDDKLNSIKEGLMNENNNK